MHIQTILEIVENLVNIAITGTMWELAIMKQKMGDLVNLNTKLLLDANLMAIVTESSVCTHTRPKISIF